MNRCFKCLRDLPIEEFYRHHMMADGRLSKCKECARFDVRKHRAENIDRIREYDRQRSKPQSLTDARREGKRRTVPAWRNADPRRLRAHNAAARAFREKKTLCEGCGKESRLEKHHPDYDKPLAVLWLCKPCHAIADKIRRLTEGVA